MASVTKVADLNTAVQSARAVSYDHSGGDTWIYVFGGSDGSGGTDAVQRFNPETYAVETYDRLPNPNFSLPVERTNDRIYLLGGSKDSNIYEYNPETKTFSNIGSFSTTRIDPFSAVKNGTIYYWGGRNEDSTHHRGILEISTSGSKSQIGTMDVDLLDGFGTNFGGRMYSIGGQSTGNEDPVPWVYQVTTSGGWIKEADLSYNGSTYSLGKIRGAPSGGSVLTAGGTHGDATNITDIFSMNDSWELTKLGDLPSKRSDAQSEYYAGNGNYYVLGGGDDQSGEKFSGIYEVPIGQFTEFVFEGGRAVKIGSGPQSYVNVSGTQADDDGTSSVVYISGTGIGRET